MVLVFQNLSVWGLLMSVDLFTKPEVKDTKITNSSIMLQIKEHYDSQTFFLLTSIVSWGNMWDELHKDDGKNHLTRDTEINDGHGIELRHDVYSALLAPFGGFGNPQVWNAWSAQLTPLIVNETMQWLAVPEYRNHNTMAMCVLRVCAPALAVSLSGVQGGVTVAGTIAEFIKKSRGT